MTDLRAVDRALYARWLRASAAYHERHGGRVTTSREAQNAFVLPCCMTPDEARYKARMLDIEDAA